MWESALTQSTTWPLIPDHATAGFDLGGLAHDVITDPQALPPFLMTLVGSTDVWAFITSTGALTAGRRDPDHAVLPYTTEDQLLDTAATTGPLTVVRGPWASTGRDWRPWAPPGCGAPPGRRLLAKSALGDEVILREDRPDIGLSFQVAWRTSARFGLVRRCELRRTASDSVELELVDGVRNILPAGVNRRLQSEYSNLVDAYKRAEIDPDTGLGVFWLNAAPTDLAEPSESLTAAVAWRLGAFPVSWSVEDGGGEAFLAGAPLPPRAKTRGTRTAHLARAVIRLGPGERLRWTTVLDTALDTAAVADLGERLREPEALRDALDDDLARSRRRLRDLLAGADGMQLTGDGTATAHHLACVVFNAMRGGVPIDGGRVGAQALRHFLQGRNRRVADGSEALLAELPEVFSLPELADAARRLGDTDLIRLADEFLPLGFGRRHGDPSRPWNRFEIVVSDPQGRPAVGYQGNWRDIFQNWEALAWSYPDLVENMVATFVGATTVDGYNPYRISDRGIDWERPDPSDPWANIGYWSDHQIIYLARLVELSRRFHPDRLRQRLNEPVLTSADVPYRIADLDEILADPVNTIHFDTERDRALRAMAAQIGGDGLLRRTVAGDLYRTTLADKLLLLLAAKVVNLVPHGGIWMNTQRPEWNDANNALVGRGVSVVTLAQLVGYVALLADLLAGVDLRVSPPLANLVRDLTEALGDFRPDEGGDPHARRQIMTRLGAAGERYRWQVYAAVDASHEMLPAEQVAAILGLLRTWLETGLHANQREDGLFHSYNTLAVGAHTADLERLPLMLEGQVAVLASGLLTGPQAAALTRALRASDLYRQDQHSYLLYPDRDLPSLLERNQIRPEDAARWSSLTTLLRDPARRVVVADARGGLHWAAGLNNARVLREVLTQLAQETGYRDRLPGDVEAIMGAYERTFGHGRFTGRSESFFGYEGLGSVYWHMVSKLALSVQECALSAQRSGEPAQVVAELRQAYRDIRSGLGFAKDAAEYGAFPADPYSHTPGHGKARQPGMTGQVKEDIIARFGELGLRVAGGRIQVAPDAIAASEWLSAGCSFDYLDVAGREQQLAVPAGALAFTFCQIPFVVRSGPDPVVTVVTVNGLRRRESGSELSERDSGHVFARDGVIARVEVGPAE